MNWNSHRKQDGNLVLRIWTATSSNVATNQGEKMERLSTPTVGEAMVSCPSMPVLYSLVCTAAALISSETKDDTGRIKRWRYWRHCPSPVNRTEMDTSVATYQFSQIILYFSYLSRETNLSQDTSWPSFS